MKKTLLCKKEFREVTMKNIAGFLLLFFIHLFFLNLGINGTLSKREKKMTKDNIPLLLKLSGFYIFKLEGKKIYKIMTFLIYFLLFSNIVCVFMFKFYEIEIAHILLDFFIEISFFLIPFLIILNFGYSKNKSNSKS